MINGKFFTGLPERMMNRTTGPDRQRSNLFWPDEEQLVPATENKKVLKGKGKITHNNYATVDQLTQDPDDSSIEPKELFKKQLTSKIEFYDMVDTPKTGKRGTYKAEKINTNKLAYNDQPINNKKHETFTSKIEFYDFADDQPPQPPPKMDRNSKVEVEKYSQNSPKLYEKRITFIDNKTNNNVQKPKSILKNTDIIVEKPKGVTKNIKKKNLSKSVENLARSKSAPNIPKENFEIIENDVRNISLKNEINDNVEVDRHAVKHKEHRIEVQQEAYENGYDERMPEERFEPVMITPRSRRQTREVREEYEDRNDNGVVSSNHSRRTRVYDEPDFEPDSYSTPRRITRPPPPQRRDIHYEEQPRNNRTREIYHKIHNEDHDPYDVSQPNFGDAPMMNNRSSRYRSLKVEEDVRRPARRTTQHHQPTQRAHRHLVSNISFGSADTDQNSFGQRRLVRNAAVTRVSVGLPD